MSKWLTSVHAVLNHPQSLVYDVPSGVFRRQHAPHNETGAECITSASTIPRELLADTHFLAATYVALLRLGITVHALDVALLCQRQSPLGLRCDIVGSKRGAIVFVLACMSSDVQKRVRAHARRVLDVAQNMLKGQRHMCVHLLLWDKWCLNKKIKLRKCAV